MTDERMDSDRYRNSMTLNHRGQQHIAGGVVSLNRKVEPPIAFARAFGARLYDVDDNQYIDYHAAFAPHLLGHNHPQINDAVRQAMNSEWSLMGSGTTPWEIRLAELIRQAVPSLELVQFTNTGSEATAHAIRLSRAWTGREDIVLILGGYNGWHNDVARSVMPGIETIGPRVSPGEYPFASMSAGIPAATRRLLHVVNFNDIDSIEYVMRRHPVACVLLEPVLQNIGVVPPLPNYLTALRELCDKYGSLLAFDEVKTGFRSALGGYQSICGVTPDLSTFGKAVANGHPLGVIGGRRDIMEQFCASDPAKRVLIAGTYNAHPLGTAAAIKTIELLQEPSVYETLERTSARMEAGLNTLFCRHGVTASISRVGSAFCVYFCDHIPVDWHDVLAHHDFDFDRRYRLALIQRGVYYFPSPCKQSSISLAHTNDDIDATLDLTEQAIRAL